jgi:threonine/homoserine/homoserine lactone efflux protein
VRRRRQSYTAYSIGCGIVWAAILGVLAALNQKEKLRRILPVFGGWWMGWTSATIARYVYPPPRSRAQDQGV